MQKFSPEFKQKILNSCHVTILILSVLLIVYMSYDTFHNVMFLENDNYMNFQLFVCVVFILDFFVELFIADDKWKYTKHRLVFLILSIPYLNLIHHYQIQLSSDALYFVRFIPMARGALALAIVLGYISRNRITSLFTSYISIMLLITYFSSLIFFDRERMVNPDVTSYWTALWWCGMEVTSLGCDIYPVTVAGKILSVVLSFMGMIMFPLFTVYLTNVIKNRHNNGSKLAAQFATSPDKSSTQSQDGQG
ncbi:MAG: two pore domain potassium channel family protein [Muribaculaceae bacterium]|nr:two pore domain potassium channel family protein [Muribaculaceae bacterium]MDE7368955.1 two pore domain potassium channel family protein [Muribaculaceae bacterium]